MSNELGEPLDHDRDDTLVERHVGDRPSGRDGEAIEVIRSEEQLVVDRTWVERGRARVRKRIVTESYVVDTERSVEQAAVEHVPADEDDDGQVHTLDDGSLSVPVLEEEVVVTKRVVVRERVIIRKSVEAEPVQFDTELSREEIDVDIDVD